MGVIALSEPIVDRLLIGDPWPIVVELRDVDGRLVDDPPPTVTVTLPGGSTASPTAERVSAGRWRAVHIVGSVGRYIATVGALGVGAAAFTAWVDATVAGPAMPDQAGYRDWAPDDGGSWEDGEITEQIGACMAAQRNVCDVAAVYPPDLVEALYRRVQHALATRSATFDVVSPDGAVEAAGRPMRDPEIRRIERAHPKLVTG